MNKRTMFIMEELARASEPMTLAGLAERHGVSQRTIRNDLNAINKTLDKQGVSFIDLGPGGAILLPEHFDRVVRSLQRSDFTSYRLSKAERQRLAAALLVSSSGYTTLASLAQVMSVSRATVIADLDGVKAFVAANGLEVVSHSSKGLVVEGSESVKRTFLLELSEEKTVNDSLRQFGPSANVGLQAGDTVAIRKLVLEQEHAHGISLADESFARLLRYLGIMVARRLQDDEIEDVGTGGTSRYLPFAEGLALCVEQYCKLSHSEQDVHHLAAFLETLHYLDHHDFTTDDVRIQLVTREFIRLISDDLGIDLNGDYTFFEMLSNHIESMLTADAVAMAGSSALREVVEQHPEVYQAVTRHLALFDGCGMRPLNDDDICFIVIHVCAAIERKRNSEKELRVVIACHAGMATSRLLLERLKVRFDFRAVDVMSAHEAETLDEGAADLVISTVPLEQCAIDHVVVRPVPTDEDYVRVGNKIDAIRSSQSFGRDARKREITSKALVERIDPIVRRIAPEKADELMVAIRREMRQFLSESKDLEGAILAPYLHELLMPSHIVLDVVCDDWKDAVAKSAQPLLEEGYITANYIDAIVANTEELGPYYLVGKGFAVPHAGLGEGSIKMGMSLIRLARPVEFGAGDEELDPVEFVCCLSPIDHDSHLKAFFHLMNMLTTTDLQSRLREARTPSEANRIIMQIERSLDS